MSLRDDLENMLAMGTPTRAILVHVANHIVTLLEYFAQLKCTKCERPSILTQPVPSAYSNKPAWPACQCHASLPIEAARLFERFKPMFASYESNTSPLHAQVAELTAKLTALDNRYQHVVSALAEVEEASK